MMACLLPSSTPCVNPAESTLGHRERGETQTNERKILLFAQEYESQISLEWILEPSSTHSITYGTYLAY